MAQYPIFEQNILGAWERSSGGSSSQRRSLQFPNEVADFKIESRQQKEENPSFSAEVTRGINSSVGPIDRFVTKSNPGRYQPYSRFQTKPVPPQPTVNAQKFIPIPKNKPDVKFKAKEKNTSVALPAPLRIIFLTGTVDHVIRWAKNLKNFPNAPETVFFEAVGILENYYSRGLMKLLVVRGQASGFLQGVFYNIDYELPDFAIGSTVSIIGRMVGSNKMRVETASVLSSQEMPGVHKMSFMCQRTVNEITKTEDMSL